jgi:hypothetical protein
VTETVSETPAEETTADPTTTTTPTEETTTAEGETAPTEAIASAEATVADIPLRVDITELTRQGQFLTLNFAATNTSPAKDSGVFYREFDDNQRGTATDGLLLIDPRNGKEYKVVRNPGEGCLCSDNVPFSLEPGDTVNLFATFDAPPASVSEVNVSFPSGLGTITGVPISSG